MLTGQQINVRAIRERDLDSFLEAVNRIEHQGEFLPVSLTSEVTLRKEYAEHGFISDTSEKHVVTDKSDNIIGAVWIFKSVPYYDAVEVGYQIFDPDSRGKGYATEALLLIRDFIFRSRRINRLEVRIATLNKSSEKVAQKAGFIHECTNRQAAWSKGQYHDMNVFVMLRHEWIELTSNNRADSA